MFWLSETRQRLESQIADSTLSHAILIAGSPGLGKRALARWLLMRYLGLTDAEEVTLAQLGERVADVTHITIPADKKQISVDQIRDLSALLTLSSHGGGGKAAVIEPANSMTIAAANSLLKTLEEPAGDTLLVLIADDVTRLPATVVSRSSVYSVRRPERQQSVAWLVDAGYSSEDAEQALVFASDAPQKAHALLASDALESLSSISQQLHALIEGKEGALAISGQWRKMDFGLVLDALVSVTQSLIYHALAPEVRNESGFSRYVIDTRDAFCYLDKVQRVARRGDVAINTDMALDTLALPWTVRLKGCFDGRATRDF